MFRQRERTLETAMGNRGARGIKLKKLYRQRDAKFDEVVSCLRRELYPEISPFPEADRKQLIDEAEELTDNWAGAEAENKLPAVSTELQRLLSEHQEICKRIIDILDAEQ